MQSGLRDIEKMYLPLGTESGCYSPRHGTVHLPVCLGNKIKNGHVRWGVFGLEHVGGFT